jgi:hypothetical protein
MTENVKADPRHAGVFDQLVELPRQQVDVECRAGLSGENEVLIKPHRPDGES